MKTHFTFTLVGLCLLVISCKKDIVETNANYQALSPVRQDISGGNWKPFIISSSTGYNLPDPLAVSSAAYQEELKELKTLSTNLSVEQKRAIDYWKVGSVLRWNEIMRELVAKHNIPP